MLNHRYGKEKYFVFYIMENGICLTARWSKKFKKSDKVEVGDIVLDEIEEDDD